jgi:sigma-B regulation protein RsbU (phosphoserine phosphatase)
MKVFQLHNLFDISRELTASLDEPSIRSLVTATVLGQFLVSRCALFVLGDDGLQLGHARGLPAGLGFPPVPAAEARAFLGALRRPRPVAELDAGPLREALERARLVLVVPLTAGERASGLLAIGERSSGAGLTDEDLDFAQALARQAQAALEGARLHRVRLAKERQDRELQIARGIQQTLLPRGWPPVPGFEIAARSRSCYEVGGDYYDVIPLEEGRLAVVIADVSGKGTPASIMMASVHASLQAMAGSARPAQMLERLNRFLYANTQASRYVTLFYAELDPGRSRLEYVNAGHVPPYLLGADGRVERLTAGGPVLGLLEDVALESGTVHLVSGDLVAAVTDGVTEALSPAGEELGDDRVCRALGSAGGAGAKEVLRSLVAAVDAWTGPAGSTDDLTALIVRAL